jgi:4-aminobutyrate aminotransferase
MGRTGKMFGFEHFGDEDGPVVPDIITVAKGIASGMPLGAFIAKSDLMTWDKGAHGTTFGGNPVACAAGLETIRLLQESLMENAKHLGAYLTGRLDGVMERHPELVDVRGLGLMIGMEFETHDLADAVVKGCFERGLIVLGCGDKSVRLSPPLVVTEEEADVALGILEETLTEVSNGR